jgi:hypothetical protein
MLNPVAGRQHLLPTRRATPVSNPRNPSNQIPPTPEKLPFVAEVFSISTSRSSATTRTITVNTVPLKWAEMGYTVQRLATTWKVLGSNPAGSEIFRQIPDRPWGPHIFPCNGYRACLPGFKRLGRGPNHLPHSAQRLKEGCNYTSIPLTSLHGLL